MRVHVPQPSIQYELRDDELKQATLLYLRRMIGVSYDEIKKDHKGKLCFTEWYDTGHGSGSTEWKREVTKEDQKILDMIRQVEEYKPKWPG